MFGEINFPGQHNDEQIILFLRRHWFILFVHLLSVLAGTAGLILIYFFFVFFDPGFSQSEYYGLLDRKSVV